MKNFILVPLSILTFITASDAQELRKRGLYKGIFASPDYSYRKLGTQFPGPLRDEREIPKLGFTAGIDMIYQFNERFALQFGVQWSEKGERTKETDLHYASPEPGAAISYNTNYKDNYIDLPFRVNYYFRERKRTGFISAGISPNIFISERRVTELNYGNRTETKKSVQNGGYNPLNPQLQIGAGIDWTFESSRLVVLPIFRYSLFRVNSGPLDGYFYSVGLGVSYMFGPAR